ncbi:MAG: MoaD/ThiS family protein [Candidatus Binatia bacterium]
MQPTWRVIVEFMGPFEFEFGTSTTAVTLPPSATVATLLEALGARWPAAQRLRVSLSGGPPQRYCLVSLDYAMLAPEGVLDAPLHDGARVCFGAPMVGG